MAATESAWRLLPGHSQRRRAAGFVLAALVALTMGGCGSTDKAEHESSPSRQTSKAPSSKAPSSKAPSPRTSSAQPSMSAADGRDVGACADGNCEIAVSGPVTFRFKGPAGPATLSVTEVGPNKVEYTIKSGNSQSQGGASGPGQSCITVLRSNGGGNSCGGQGDAARPSPQPDAVLIQAVTSENGTAILRIVSG
ncbi:hypothetical protein [Streptomyces sp. NBC_01361]|uniref:hypothetical protein n=1 Tax=Streptomyces sp. NBC_01361 TaxID=2903838 RepID=UPI002E3713EE|nr:hypothetical protein [Streptomyces sp. NBC_01361]